MEKRYQVFVSSTYVDLKEERKAVIQALLEMDCIPAGMELFPAADEDQLAFIKRVIDDCDYYLVIVGGRYGSQSATGLSYTEQEYDYAVSRGLKVIALMHEHPDEIALGKSESEPELRTKLDRFRAKLASGRIVKYWNRAEELPGLVALSMSKTIKMFPAVGWIRASNAANEDLLSEIHQLQKENRTLRDALGSAKYHADTTVDIPDLAGLDDQLRVGGTYYDTYYNRKDSWSSNTSWRKVFAAIAPSLVSRPTEATVESVLADALCRESGRSDPHVDKKYVETIRIQLQALQLVKVEYLPAGNGFKYLFWSLTPKGEKTMFELRAIRAQTQPENVQS